MRIETHSSVCQLRFFLLFFLVHLMKVDRAETHEHNSRAKQRLPGNLIAFELPIHNVNIVFKMINVVFEMMNAVLK